MNNAKLFPLFMLPLVAIGCAQAADETESAEAAASSARIDFNAAIGSIEVDGRQLCTGALVDVDPNATLGGTSAAGRQVVLGGACVEAMQGRYHGGAVFITHVAGAIVAVPIIALNLAVAAGGLAVGLLADVIPGIFALKPYHGGGGASSATLLQVNQDGVQYGAHAEVEQSSQFSLRTCDNLNWRPQWSLPQGVPQPLSSAIAIVNVGGQLLFAAAVEAFCVVRAIGNVLTLPLAAAGAVLDGLGLIGSGRMVATYALPAGTTTIRVRLTEATNELRINARGFVSASMEGASCTALLGSCTLRPANGFDADSFADVAINTNSIFPKNVYVSVPR